MIANFVVFKLKPGKRREFIDASLGNSRGSIAGTGCVATSILADPARENVAYVFEVFVDNDAFEHHHNEAYYQLWLKQIAGLLASPYQLLQSTTFPDDDSFRYLRLAVSGNANPGDWTS